MHTIHLSYLLSQGAQLILYEHVEEEVVLIVLRSREQKNTIPMLAINDTGQVSIIFPVSLTMSSELTT